MTSHIYLLPNHEGTSFKIGVSIDPVARIRQIGAQFDEAKCLAFEVSAEASYEIEGKLHRVMGKWRTPQQYRNGNTEWFDIACYPIAVALCEEFAERLGLKKTLGPNELFPGQRKAKSPKALYPGAVGRSPTKPSPEVLQKRREYSRAHNVLARTVDAAKADANVLGYTGYYTVVTQGETAFCAWHLAFKQCREYRAIKYDSPTQIGFIELSTNSWLFDKIPHARNKFSQSLEDAVLRQYGLAQLMEFNSLLSVTRREELNTLAREALAQIEESKARLVAALAEAA